MFFVASCSLCGGGNIVLICVFLYILLYHVVTYTTLTCLTYATGGQKRPDLLSPVSASFVRCNIHYAHMPYTFFHPHALRSHVLHMLRHKILHVFSHVLPHNVLHVFLHILRHHVLHVLSHCFKPDETHGNHGIEMVKRTPHCALQNSSQQGV